MQQILVTGANKGVGLAIAHAILQRKEETEVLLGSRDRARGESAREGLLRLHPEWEKRVQVLELDVTDDSSVRAAAEAVARQAGGRASPLHGFVNNAGIANRPLSSVFDVNVLGVRRVCEAFRPLLAPAGGRIVNITSGAGPMFVAKCSPPWQRLLTDSKLEWPQLQSFLEDCVATKGGPEALARRGLGDGGAYGLSKACANAYTVLFAREHPALLVNACTPGFIETDMTRPLAAAQDCTPSEMGMKPPKAGAAAPCFLLFGEPGGSGHFYGSDAKRSPLDRYRPPSQAQPTRR